MSRSAALLTRCLEGFPRVSGDEPPAITAGRMKIAFSPRERG